MKIDIYIIGGSVFEIVLTTDLTSALQESRNSGWFITDSVRIAYDKILYIKVIE